MRTILHALANVTATVNNRPAQSKMLTTLNPPTLEITERQIVDRHIFIKTYKITLIQQYLPLYYMFKLNCKDKLKRLNIIFHIL